MIQSRNSNEIYLTDRACPLQTEHDRFDLDSLRTQVTSC